MPGRDSLSMKASYKMKNIQAIVNGKKYITSKLNITDGKKVDYYRLTDWGNRRRTRFHCHTRRMVH